MLSAAKSFPWHNHRIKNPLLPLFEHPTSHSGFLNYCLLWRSIESAHQSCPLNKRAWFHFSSYQHSRPLILPWVMPLTGYLSKPLSLSKCHHSSPPHKTASHSSPLLTQNHGIAASPSAFGQNRCKKPTEIGSSQANGNCGIAKLWCIDAAVKECGGYKNWNTGVFLIWPYVVTHYLICTKMTRPQCAYCQYFPVPWTSMFCGHVSLFAAVEVTLIRRCEVICQCVFIHSIYVQISRWQMGEFGLAFVLILGWN